MSYGREHLSRTARRAAAPLDRTRQVALGAVHPGEWDRRVRGAEARGPTPLTGDGRDRFGFLDSKRHGSRVAEPEALFPRNGQALAAHADEGAGIGAGARVALPSACARARARFGLSPACPLRPDGHHPGGRRPPNLLTRHPAPDTRTRTRIRPPRPRQPPPTSPPPVTSRSAPSHLLASDSSLALPTDARMGADSRRSARPLDHYRTPSDPPRSRSVWARRARAALSGAGMCLGRPGMSAGARRRVTGLCAVGCGVLLGWTMGRRGGAGHGQSDHPALAGRNAESAFTQE